MVKIPHTTSVETIASPPPKASHIDTGVLATLSMVSQTSLGIESAESMVVVQ